MSPVFGSRKHAKAEARPPKHAPSYRRDDEAVEYRQEQKAEVTAESDTKAGTTDPRFKPLPRCRRCGRAG